MEEQQDQTQFFISDLNTKVTDLEQRNENLRERVLLLGTNLIESKEETEKLISEIKKNTQENSKDLQRIKSITTNIINELDNFVRKDEMVVIERMLKDFQPLDFIRRKDLEEISKEIKTRKDKK